MTLGALLTLLAEALLPFEGAVALPRSLPLTLKEPKTQEGEGALSLLECLIKNVLYSRRVK